MEPWWLCCKLAKQQNGGTAWSFDRTFSISIGDLNKPVVGGCRGATLQSFSIALKIKSLATFSNTQCLWHSTYVEFVPLNVEKLPSIPSFLGIQGENFISRSFKGPRISFSKFKGFQRFQGGAQTNIDSCSLPTICSWWKLNRSPQIIGTFE